jgi:serine/threonine protein phosphatase PrpC
MAWRTRRADGSPDGPDLVDVGAATDAGPRPDNQDRLHVDHRLAVLSDGMGGYEGGATAAELTVAAVSDALGSPVTGGPDRQAVAAAFTAANDAVRNGRSDGSDHAQMGATLTVAVLLDGTVDASRWRVANVGDSPGFLVDARGTTLVTVDDTVPGQLLRVGAISETDALTHPYRHMVLHAIGVESTVDADQVEVELGAGEAIVLVSDGVSDILGPAEIGAVTRSAPTAAGSARALVDRAIAGGSTDNATAIVVRHVASSRG